MAVARADNPDPVLVRWDAQPLADRAALVRLTCLDPELERMLDDALPGSREIARYFTRDFSIVSVCANPDAEEGYALWVSVPHLEKFRDLVAAVFRDTRRPYASLHRRLPRRPGDDDPARLPIVRHFVSDGKVRVTDVTYPPGWPADGSRPPARVHIVTVDKSGRRYDIDARTVGVSPPAR